MSLVQNTSYMLRVNIRNTQDPRAPRVFDVLVDMNGRILKYLIQNIHGLQYVDAEDVELQIKEALNKAS